MRNYDAIQIVNPPATVKNSKITKKYIQIHNSQNSHFTLFKLVGGSFQYF